VNFKFLSGRRQNYRQLSFLYCLNGNFGVNISSVSLSSVRTQGMEDLLGPSVGQSVCLSVGLQSVLWQNGRADLDTVWGGEWSQSRDFVIDGVVIVEGKGAVVINWAFVA